MSPDAHLQSVYPELKSFFNALGPVTLPRQDGPVCEAVVKTVIGQMLSGAAGNAIYQRVVRTAAERNVARTIELDEDALIKCGVSSRKRRTIKEFSQVYLENPCFVNGWCNLSNEELRSAVNAIWGMSDWTASILAIFQFGKEDVFPETDGSIVRAMQKVESRYYESRNFDPSLGAPFRSYLSLYFWKSLDTDFWHEDGL